MDLRITKPSLRRSILCTAVMSGHVLLLLVFSRNSTPPIRTTDSDSQSGVLFLLELPPLVKEEPSPRQDEPFKVASIPRSAEPVASDNAITAPSEAPPLRPDLDWHREAEEVARESVGSSAQAKGRKFGEQPATPYKKCIRKPQFEWNPEPPRAGIAGGLPYVRLGERCAVGLGFFGCALGKKPEANSQLFDSMNDPNRPTSSVPDIEDCVL